MEPLSLGAAPLLSVKFTHVGKKCRDVGMVVAQRLFCDRQRSLIERLRFGVATWVELERSNGVDRCRNIRMMGTERFRAHRQQLFCNWYGSRDFPASVKLKYPCVECGCFILLRDRRRADPRIDNEHDRQDDTVSIRASHGSPPKQKLASPISARYSQGDREAACNDDE